MVEALVTYDENVNLVGELATDWSQSEDGLTWTFNLREGVSFSNGEPLNAAVVVWNMERILNPETGSGRKADIGGEGAIWQAVGEMTVSVTLPTANVVFPNIFATFGGIGIVHPDSVVEETGQIVTPIGTGPFIIGEFEGTTSLTLNANPNYWQEGLPYLDSVDIIVIVEDSAREERPGADQAVRHAMAHAVDRAAICQVGNFGLCVTLQGPTGPSSPWYNDYAPYGDEMGGPDVEKARSILADAATATRISTAWSMRRAP